MASKSETGNAINVANFYELISFAEGYGSTYNPSKDRLKLPQLNTLYTEADASQNNVITQITEEDNAINARRAAFEGLRSLSTRLLNALIATDASQETIEDAKGFNRKMQGKRASKIEIPLDPNLPTPKTKSSSQQSFDQMIEHFEGWISLLSAEPSYQPNEEDLKVASLKTRLENLIVTDKAVANAKTRISNARIARNKIISLDDFGVVNTAGDVKKYVKSVYGATSPEFGQVKGIKFVKFML